MRLVLLAGCIAVAGAASAADFGQVFQSHAPNGTAYWVVLCTQADECFEYAYRWCDGAYSPLDATFNPYTGLRFQCKKPHKDRPKPAGPSYIGTR